MTPDIGRVEYSGKGQRFCVEIPRKRWFVTATRAVKYPDRLELCYHGEVSIFYKVLALIPIKRDADAVAAGR